MNLGEILGILVAIVVLVGLPAMMIWAAVDHHRTPASKRRGGSSGPGIGGAMLELDRLVARPSVEHVVEAQTPIVRDDEEDGD